MNTVYNEITCVFKEHHGVSQEVPSSALNGGLENTAADQSISAPLPGVSVLRVNSNSSFLYTPRSGEQFYLWPLPADQSSTG